jgi:hypothetical protein
MIALLKSAIVLTFLDLLASACFADLVAPPTPYIVASADGSHYFKMIPDKKDKWNMARAKGTVYEVRRGKDKVIFNFSGWYSYQVFLSNDGRHLIRMGNWPTGTPKAEDLAIAFYVDGQERKSYSTLDLLTDPNKAPRSISHYSWLQTVNPEYLPVQMISLVTVENLEITFDISSGAIKFKEPLMGPSSK